MTAYDINVKSSGLSARISFYLKTMKLSRAGCSQSRQLNGYGNMNILLTQRLIRKHFKALATSYELLTNFSIRFPPFPKAGNITGKIKISSAGTDSPSSALEQTLIDLNAEADFDGNHGYVFAPYVDNVVIQSPTPLGVRYGAAAFL